MTSSATWPTSRCAASRTGASASDGANGAAASRYELFRVKTLLVASCAAAMIAAIVWAAFLAPRFRGAARALEDGRLLLKRRDYPEAARALTRGTALIEGLPGGSHISQEIATALRLTERFEEADRLHRLVDHLRFAEASTSPLVLSAKDVERHCKALWDLRGFLLERPGSPLEKELAQRLRDDLLELAVIRSNLRVHVGERPGEGHRGAPGGSRAAGRSRGACSARATFSIARGRRTPPHWVFRGWPKRPADLRRACRRVLPGSTTPQVAYASPRATSRRLSQPSPWPLRFARKTYGRIFTRACAPSAWATTRTP